MFIASYSTYLETVLSREVRGHEDAARLLHDLGVGGEVRDCSAHKLGGLSLGEHLFGQVVHLVIV